MTESRLYAFSCSTNDPEESRTIFARNHSEAKRSYVGEVGDVASVEVVRKPSYDQYAPGPVPPLVLIDDGWYFECSNCSRRINLDETGYERMTQAEVDAIAARNAVTRRELTEFDRRDPMPESPPENSSPRILQEHRWRLEERSRRRRNLSWNLIEHPLSRTQIVEVGDAVFCDRRCHMEHAEKVADVNLAHEDAEKEAERRWPGSPTYQSKRWPYLEPSVTFHPPGFDHPVSWSVGTGQIYRSGTDSERWAALDASEGDEDGQEQG